MIVGKKHGGLEIRNLMNQSKALMIKWLWKFNNEEQSYWKEVIKAKYEEEDNWMTHPKRGLHHMGLVYGDPLDLFGLSLRLTQIKVRNREN